MGITQGALAKQLGVRREVIARIETGKRNISCQLAKKLSACSGVSMRDIRTNVRLYDQEGARIFKHEREIPHTVLVLPYTPRIL